jgi:hypothetical protein
VAKRTAELTKTGTALARGTVQGLSAAMAESAILGTSFEEALGRHLTSSLIASLGALGANEIGTHFDKTDALGNLNHKIAHAVLGCAVGAASADSSDGCAPGAVGAVIGELVAEWYGDATGYADLEQQRNAETDPIKRQALSEELAEQKRLIIGISELAAVGGTAVLLQSGAEQLQLAKMTANNAAANNYLNHTKPSLLGLSEKEQYDRAAAACGPSDPAACRQATELAQLSRERDQQLQQACGAGPTKQCAFFQDQARAMGNNVYRDGNFVWANSPDVGFGLNVSTVSTPGANPALTNSWHHRVSQSTSEALVFGVPGAAGRVLSTSGGAFVAGAGFDAVGQYAQNGTVRPGQSLVAGTTAAVFMPLASRGVRWVPFAGAGAAATNTTFNNAYYDESTNVWLAAGLGAGFSAAGQAIGPRVQNVAAPYITSTPRIPITGAAYIPSTPARLPSVSSYVGSTVNNTVSNVPSFIPLDNGKSQQGVKP